MAAIINYIWQSSFCLLFLYGIYWCFLKEEKALTLARVFILLAPVLAMLFPLLEIPVDFVKPSISLEDTEFLQSLTATPKGTEIAGVYGLPEFTVRDTKLPLLLGLKDYFIIFYLLIVFLSGGSLFWQYLQLRMLLYKGWYQTTYQLKGEFFLVPTFGMAPVFSFFDKLFWDETQNLRTDEKDHIIKHEIEHIRQGHSWDVLYFQLLSIIFWFNPGIHLMRAALVDTHEYMADAKVLQKTDNSDSYRQLIVKIAFKGLDLPIGSHFNRSTTRKRIMMMKKSRKINWFKLLMVLPLTAMLLGLVSMKTMPDSYFLTESRTENLLVIKKQLVSALDSIQVSAKVKKIMPVHYEYVSGLKDRQVIAQIGGLQYEIGEISNKDEYRKVLEMLRVFKQNSGLKKDHPRTGLVTGTDKMPVPAGGFDAWQKFMSSNLKMTAESKEMGVEGTIHLEVIIDKDGEVLSPVIKQSLGMGLDEEVLRVMALPTVPKWTAGEKDGKAVSTLLTIPVHFTAGQMDHFIPSISGPHPSGSVEIPRTQNDTLVFDLVEEMPSPKGGKEGWAEYIRENLEYPEKAKTAGIAGTVYLTFVIDRQGKVKNPQILRGIGGGADEEALRVLENSPRWTPGMHKGEKVPVSMKVPIQFNLPKEQPNKDVSALNSQKLPHKP